MRLFEPEGEGAAHDRHFSGRWIRFVSASAKGSDVLTIGKLGATVGRLRPAKPAQRGFSTGRRASWLTAQVDYLTDNSPSS
jgi:hypothetical protein